MEDLFAIFEKNAHRAQSTVSGYSRAWRAFTDYLARAKIKKPEEIKDAHVIGWQRELIASGLNQSTVRLKLAQASAVFTFLMKFGTIRRRPNPFSASEPIRRGARKVKYLTPAEAARLLAAAKAHSRDIYLFCLLCCYLGLRRCEALSMRWDQFDWEEHKVYVAGVKTESSAAYLPFEHFAAELAPYRRVAGFVVAPESAGKGIRWNYRSQFKTVAKAAGVIATPHTLRHTAATILIDRGVPLAEVSRFLRHSDLGTTQIYADIRGVTCKSVAAAFKLNCGDGSPVPWKET